MMTRKTRILSLSALVLGAAVALTAMASAKGDGGKRMDKVFEKFDANKDGKLTESEVPERAWKRLSKADTNQDKAVTKPELKAKLAERKAKRAERKGKRGEGKRGKGKRGEGKRGDKAAE